MFNKYVFFFARIKLIYKSLIIIENSQFALKITLNDENLNNSYSNTKKIPKSSQIRRFWRFRKATWCSPSWHSRNTWGSRSSRRRPGRALTNWQPPLGPAFPTRFLLATLTHTRTPRRVRAVAPSKMWDAAPRGPPESARLARVLKIGRQTHFRHTYMYFLREQNSRGQKSVQWDTDLNLGSHTSTHWQEDQIFMRAHVCSSQALGAAEKNMNKAARTLNCYKSELYSALFSVSREFNIKNILIKQWNAVQRNI